MSDAKPCPFCGGKAELIKSDLYPTDTWFVVCHECEIKTFLFKTPEMALSRWNRRADDVIDRSLEEIRP